MAKPKFAKINWKAAVKDNVANQDKKTSWYLNLPKGMNMYKESTDTRNKLDILPYLVTNENHLDRAEGIAEKGTYWYRSPFKIHRNIGANNESVVCPASFGKKCPICEYRKEQQENGVEYEDLKHLNTSNRVLYAVIPHSKEYPKKVHLWDISHACFQNVLNEEINENEEYAAFPDLEDGYTLDIRFTEEKIGKNSFSDCSRIDFVERKSPYDESILDEVPNLDECLIVLSYKALQAKFHESEEEEDEVDEEVPPKRRQTNRQRSQNDDDDDDEEEDKEITRRKQAKKKRQVVEEVEDEEDEEPGDGEDEEGDEEDGEGNEGDDGSDDEIEHTDTREAKRTAPTTVSRRNRTNRTGSGNPTCDTELIVTDEASEVGEEFYCKACKGTGLNSKGGKCRPCSGTGVNKTAWEEELERRELGDVEEDIKEEIKESKQSKKQSKKTSGKCPYGHTFGKDCEKYDECDECDVWEDCDDAR